MFRKSLLVGLLLSLLMLAALPGAAQSSQTVYGTVQEFEGGLMIWRSDTGQIWALINDGTVFSFPASAYSALPDNPIFGDPPSRLRPIMGFGKIWGNVANIRSLLGWPTRNEIGFNMPISTSGTTIALTQLDGSVITINGGRWSRGFVTPTPPPPPGATILAFAASPTTAPRDTEVALNWNMQGVDVAIIEVYDSADSTFITSQTGLPQVGGTSITVPNRIQGDLRVTLFGARIVGTGVNATYQKLVQRTVIVRVESVVDATVSTYAAYQAYQLGFMIWRADDEAVTVFYATDGSTGGRYSVYPISSYRGLPDNPIPNVPPSAGLVWPINAFGRIWGNNPAVRNVLGWGIANERGYTTAITLAGLVPQRMTLPDGGTILLTPFGQWAYV